MSQVVNKLPLRKRFLCCLDLKYGGYTASVLGIIHPALFISLYYSEKMHDWVTTISGIMAAFLFIASFVLFAGVFIRKHSMVMVWVFFSLVFIVTMVVIIILLGVRYVYQGKFWISGHVFLQMFLYMFFFYLIIVVNSFAVQIEGEEEAEVDND